MDDPPKKSTRQYKPDRSDHPAYHPPEGWYASFADYEDRVDVDFRPGGYAVRRGNLALNVPDGEQLQPGDVVLHRIEPWYRDA